MIEAASKSWASIHYRDIDTGPEMDTNRDRNRNTDRDTGTDKDRDTEKDTDRGHARTLNDQRHEHLHGHGPRINLFRWARQWV